VEAGGGVTRSVVGTLVEIYLAQEWTLPHLIDRKISMDYKQEGAEDEQKGYGTAKLLKRV
jgi:hypothetical protein